MIISIHQPNFFPWLGYFYKIAHSDMFVVLDDVQYTKNSYINRSQIKTPQGCFWLTIPVHRSLSTKINEIDTSQLPWKEKCIKTLESFYKKAPYFMTYKEEVFFLLSQQYSSMADLNIVLIKYMCSVFDIKTPFFMASTLSSNLKSDDRLIELIEHLKGNVYLSGLGGQNYQLEKKFEDKRIKLVYSSFKHPIYPQLWGEFEKGLSALDFLFNCGADFNSMFKGEK